MCVIVHKERGKDIPSDEIIEKCFKKNPDGSGILLHRDGTKTLEIHKGYMKLDDFKTVLKELNVNKNDDLVMHFRITTSGGTSPENCHPFPISNKIDDLKATRINTPRAFVHNGVLGKGDEILKISDTQVFVKDIISREEVSDHLENSEIKKIITKVADSGQRFFIADAEKDIFERYGTWYENDGIWYSNLAWKNYYSYNYANWNSYYGGKRYYSKYYDDDYYYGNSWYGKNSGKTATKTNFVPNINSVLCPYCDKQMNVLMEGHEVFICPDCGTIYDDKKFEIYDQKNGCWISIVDLNDFEKELAS